MGALGKRRSAPERLDAIKPELPACQALVLDAGYGCGSRVGKKKGLYVAQMPGNIVA